MFFFFFKILQILCWSLENFTKTTNFFLVHKSILAKIILEPTKARRLFYVGFHYKATSSLKFNQKGPRKRKRDNSGKTKKKNEKRKLSKRKKCNGHIAKERMYILHNHVCFLMSFNQSVGLHTYSKSTTVSLSKCLNL